MSNPSPGPWENDLPFSYHVSGEDNDGNIFIIATISDALLVGDPEANAQLIAATPNLLEVAQWAYEDAMARWKETDYHPASHHGENVAWIGEILKKAGQEVYDD